MKLDFWHERWQQGQIGFHEKCVNKELIRYWPSSIPKTLSNKVFIPLCGKSLDILWLRDQGHHVIGCELSPIAVNDFFNEHNLTPTRTKVDSFILYETDNISIYCGDFFNLNEQHLLGCQLIYDRASLIALPKTIGDKYAKHLIALTQKQTTTLFLITLDYDQNEMNGPPFSVTRQQVNTYYQDYFGIKVLSVKNLLEDNVHFKNRGLSYLNEYVFLLSQP